jgi:NAD(P)-dependent dehydrogenase (short-subunit alcohol dehydrogenase family)
MQKTVLITGASRGIGLGMVKQFLSDESYFVIACARNPSASLETLKENFAGRLAVEKLDVSCKSDFAQLADKYDSLDVVIANAGISNKNHPVDPLLTCSVEDMMATFETNCVGTLLTMQSFTNALIKSKSKVKVFTCISSRYSLTHLLTHSTNHLLTHSLRLASIGQNTFGGYTSYRASKAALNQLVKTYDNDKSVRANGIVSVCIHPGWVQTDMGKLSLTYSLTHSPTHSLTPSLTHSLPHSLTHYSLTHSLTHSFIHLFK